MIYLLMSALSIMDNTEGFYPFNVGSIPAGQTNGNCSSVVESRIVIPVVVGSNPISYPKI